MPFWKRGCWLQKVRNGSDKNIKNSRSSKSIDSFSNCASLVLPFFFSLSASTWGRASGGQNLRPFQVGQPTNQGFLVLIHRLKRFDKPNQPKPRSLGLTTSFRLRVVKAKLRVAIRHMFGFGKRQCSVSQRTHGPSSTNFVSRADQQCVVVYSSIYLSIGAYHTGLDVTLGSHSHMSLFVSSLVKTKLPTTVDRHQLRA